MPEIRSQAEAEYGEATVLIELLRKRCGQYSIVYDDVLISVEEFLAELQDSLREEIITKIETGKYIDLKAALTNTRSKPT